MYFYSEENRKMDCLYRVTEAPQAAVDATKAALTRQNVAGPETKLDVAEIQHAKTLGSLGPFRPTPIDFASLGFSLASESHAYTVSIADKAVAQAMGFDRGEGMLSPRFQITLSAAVRKEVGIPDDADSFSFGYPMRGVRDHLLALDVHDARAGTRTGPLLQPHGDRERLSRPVRLRGFFACSACARALLVLCLCSACALLVLCS